MKILHQQHQRLLLCQPDDPRDAPESSVSICDRVRVWPAHVDPTVAYHERMFVTAGDEVLDVWQVDLRGW